MGSDDGESSESGVPAWLAMLGSDRVDRWIHRASRVCLAFAISLPLFAVGVWYGFIATRGRHVQRGTTIARQNGFDGLIADPQLVVILLVASSGILFVGWFALGVAHHHIHQRY